MKREHLQIVGTICATVLMLAWFTHSPARPAKASEPDSVNSFRQTALLLRHAESRQELIEQLRRERTVYIPILIEQMGADESRIRHWLRQAAKSVPIIQNNLALPAEVFRAGASWGLLEILREGGAATPEELELLYPALRKALADESVRVRMNAAASLGALGSMNPETEKMCVAALRDSNRWVRHNGVFAVWKLCREDKRKAAEFLKNAETNASMLEAHLTNLETVAERAAAPGRMEFE